MATIKQVPANVRGQIQKAKSDASEGGKAITANEKQAIRESAAAEILKETKYAPTAGDLKTINRTLNANGIAGFRSADTVAMVADEATRRRASVATEKAAKFLQGLHPVGSPQGYLDTAHAKAGEGDNDYPALQVGFDVGGWFKEHQIKAGDPKALEHLQVAGEVMTEATQNLLPAALRKQVGMVSVYPKPNKALAELGAEQFRQAFSSGDAVKSVAEALTPAEAKALRSVSAKLISSGAKSGKGVIYLPSSDERLDAKVAQSAMEKVIAGNPDLQWFAGLKIEFLAAR